MKKEKGRKRAMTKDEESTHGRPELVLGRTGWVPWAAGRMPASGSNHKAILVHLKYHLGKINSD